MCSRRACLASPWQPHSCSRPLGRVVATCRPSRCRFVNRRVSLPVKILQLAFRLHLDRHAERFHLLTHAVPRVYEHIATVLPALQPLACSRLHSISDTLRSEWFTVSRCKTELLIETTPGEQSAHGEDRRDTYSPGLPPFGGALGSGCEPQLLPPSLLICDLYGSWRIGVGIARSLVACR